MESKINEKAVQIFAKAPGELGVNVVKSPVKLTILSMLKDTDMEFDEIVKNTGKSKSTISVHLKSLREDGIVNYRFDANDHRKKIFYISSKFLGEVKSGDPRELEERKAEFLFKNIIDVDNFKFSFLLFHTLRSTLIQEGVNINPILTETGKNMGYAIFKKIYDEDINNFSQNIMASKDRNSIMLSWCWNSWSIIFIILWIECGCHRSEMLHHGRQLLQLPGWTNRGIIFV